MSLPKLFIERISHMLNDESDAFFATYEKPRYHGLRINPLKITPERLAQIAPFQLKPVPFCHTGFYYKLEDEPGKHPYHQAGLYYIQEPSAMAVADCLDAKPGERILDLCAAPGGKTTQIAGSMKNQGFLMANEINAKRAKALSENIERCGITNALVTNEKPERLANRFAGYFDKILVDAPCSGEGMFRKDPEAIEYWSLDHVKHCASMQKEILDHAYHMLKPGGILVYSTCTFSAEENEQSIDHFLDHYPDLELLPIQKKGGMTDGNPDWSISHRKDLIKTARLWPHHVQGEGHFIAKCKKAHTSTQSENNSQTFTQTAKKCDLKDFYSFEKESLTTSVPGTLFFMKNHLFSIPKDFPDFSGLRIVRTGLHIGEQKKQRFEPNHALALGLDPSNFKQKLNLSSTDKEWASYLRGETLPSNLNKGWTIVTIDNYPIGWGKVANGTLKNFYPKGLRRH
ncbi:NOL1/NOP2/sun family putative RNA methylase [Terrilactibacillus sp. BCM23-1]|uniref:NOL1/NOP2/sun family putative RNA methylase n=1 Tax=Terrilactibacillus tamarindi TaxID=2599694 RepID=A0A6N8CT40_9BACI|nr:RsmF rRNA methyltransferase first C-terminal domain-containing protein [Terrilactibacillus tamarindi]MTT32115.1 NOL1/NOP2/sun family putative RNA methylase [Terrilactibacillus tamarindi]